MSRGPKKWDEVTIARLQREGRGKGEGSDYQPWIKVQDFPSKGTSNRVWGLKTHRDHHLLSNVELKIFTWLEYAPNVLDIREQYPLDRDVTRELAAANQIRHPHYPGTTVPAVMTIDFLVTLFLNGQPALMGVNGKSDTEAENEESIAKLELQRLYFSYMDVPHHIVFDSRIPDRKIKNIQTFRDAWLKPGEEEPDPGFYDRHQTRMLGELRRPRSEALAEFCNKYDVRHGLEPGTGLRVAKMLMYTRALKPDLNIPDLAAAPLSSFIVTAQAGKLRAIN